MTNKYLKVYVFKKINYWCDNPIALLIISTIFAIIGGFFGVLAYKYHWLG